MLVCRVYKFQIEIFKCNYIRVMLIFVIANKFAFSTQQSAQ